MIAGTVHGTEEIEFAEISGSHESSVIQGTDETIVAWIKINVVIDGKASDPQIGPSIDKSAGVSLYQNQP